jgi:hypothetical protein
MGFTQGVKKAQKKPGFPGFDSACAAGLSHVNRNKGQQQHQNATGQGQHHWHVLRDGFHHILLGGSVVAVIMMGHNELQWI